jgi:hypothetical protein
MISPPLASVNVATTVYDFTLAGEGDGRDKRQRSPQFDGEEVQGASLQ